MPEKPVVLMDRASVNTNVQSKLFKNAGSERGAAYVLAIVAMVTGLTLSLALLRVSNSCFLAEASRTKQDAARYIAEAGIDYASWQVLNNGASVPYTADVSLSNGTFHVTAVDDSARDTGAVRIESTGTSGTSSHTANRVIMVYAFRDLFDYPNGRLSGNGGWAGAATSTQVGMVSGSVKLTGGLSTQEARRAVNIEATHGCIWVRCLINGEVGARTIWSLLINDSSNRNIARWYGTGTSARGRIGGTALVTAVRTLSGGWQEIAVKIDPAADTSEFFFNGNSMGVLSHASQGASDAIGWLKFERTGNVDNPNMDFLYFDDLRVIR